MRRNDNRSTSTQQGFSLIEMMVGLVIGLIVVLVMTQTLTTFEGQKRSTSGTADAQIGGSVATYSIQRQLQMAGYGLPIFSVSSSPMKCVNATTSFDHDGDGGVANPTTAAETAKTPPINLRPVVITDGGVGGNDSISIGRALGDFAGLPVKVDGVATLPTLEVTNNMGCKANDVAVIVTESGGGLKCALRKVQTIPAGNTKAITLTSSDASDIQIGSMISCPGAWMSVTYAIVNGVLMETTGSSATGTTQRAIMSNIVSFQAQYGLAPAVDDNYVGQWVNATGDFSAAALTAQNSSRIRAVRFVIVARNDLLERNAVSSPGCTAAGLCAWAGSSPAAAGTNATINLAGDANWNRYRYRIFETSIPMRNIGWSREIFK